jgi:hypothetical protein
LEPPDAGHQCGDRHKEAFGLQAAAEDRVTVTKKRKIRVERLGHGPGRDSVEVPGKGGIVI